MNMEIQRNLAVPTGNILVVDGQHGSLECVSLGDYGADKNLNQYKRVEHGPMLPLTEKWVWTISTQYGCSMGCKFCDVPKVGPGKNATTEDMIGQLEACWSTHPDIRMEDCKRINIHFARMGEPTWNPNVCTVAMALAHGTNTKRIHPVVSTMMPKHNDDLLQFLDDWCYIKNHTYDGNAGLQLSINSTDDAEREQMFNGQSLSLANISRVMATMERPVGRKYTLNFAVAGDWDIDAKKLASLFDPRHFVVKLTPMHQTDAAALKGWRTAMDSAAWSASQLEAAGFEVLFFMASDEEDASRITCGNAILSGTVPMEV